MGLIVSIVSASDKTIKLHLVRDSAEKHVQLTENTAIYTTNKPTKTKSRLWPMIYIYAPTCICQSIFNGIHTIDGATPARRIICVFNYNATSILHQLCSADEH